MIPQASVIEWSRSAPWPTLEQVEQDLLLSRLIIEIAKDEYLAEELVFRGGTCLHKLILPKPFRYSEDLDYVRRTAGGIADVMRAVTRIGERLGMEVRTQISKQPQGLPSRAVRKRCRKDASEGRVQHLRTSTRNASRKSALLSGFKLVLGQL